MGFWLTLPSVSTAERPASFRSLSPYLQDAELDFESQLDLGDDEGKRIIRSAVAWFHPRASSSANLSERRDIQKTLNKKAFAQEVRRALLSHARVGSRVLLAVSGGPDSTAMALAVASFAADAGLELGIASIDHQLRPESATETRFVGDLAKSLGIPFFTRRISVSTRTSVEAKARRLRYAALEAIAREEKFQFIATAHTANDQAETVLLRLGRGSALRGQRAVLAKRGRVIRPLLGVERSDVVAFLKDAGVEPVRDSSNFDPLFTRVRVRQVVLPALSESLGPSAVQKIAQSATLAAEDEALLEAQARRLYRKVVRRGRDGGLVVDRMRLVASPTPWVRRVLIRMARELGARQLALRHVEATTRRLQAPAPWRLTWPGGFTWTADGAELQLRRSSDPPTLAVEVNDSETLDRAGLRISSSRIQYRKGLSGLCVPVTVPWPITIRTVRRGERMSPLGGGAARKIKDVLIDHGVERERRKGVLAVCDAKGTMLGLYGIRPSRAAECQLGESVFCIQIASLGDPSPWTLEVPKAMGRREG